MMATRTMIAAILALALPTGASAQVNTALQPGETLLQVSAEGEATVRPDAAFLTVGVVATGTTAREATDGDSRTMTAVIAALRKAGVDERYIRTQQINVQPRFARTPGASYDETAQIAGYVARNSVAVTVVKLSTAPEVIAAAFAAGANSVNGPDLRSEDPQSGIAAARHDALRNARAEAQDYADGLGMKIARVLRVSENGGSIEPIRYITVTGSRSFASSAPPPPPPPPPPPVAGGELKRSVQLHIDYALIPK